MLKTGENPIFLKPGFCSIWAEEFGHNSAKFEFQFWVGICSNSCKLLLLVGSFIFIKTEMGFQSSWWTKQLWFCRSSVHQRRLKQKHLSLKIWVIRMEGGGSDIQMKAQTKQKIHFKKVHFCCADPSHFCIICIVVVPEKNNSTTCFSKLQLRFPKFKTPFLIFWEKKKGWL